MTSRLRSPAVKAAIFLHVGLVACSAPETDASPRPAAGAAGEHALPSVMTPVGGSSAVSGPAGAGAAGASGRAAEGGSGGRNATGSAGAAGTRGRAAGSGGADSRSREAGSGGSSSAPTSATGVWMPKPGTTWQWQLTGNIDTSLDVEMYDLDLFQTSNDTIQALHTAGHKLVCYFSAGSYEPDRPDSAELEKTTPGKALDGWPDEKWLDIRKSGVRDIMKARLDTAKTKHCDGVEPDNVDGYDNDNGLGLTKQDQLDYLGFLATEAHARGLSIGLKNSLDLIPNVVSMFDWALDEECLKYDECDALMPFISANKAVFHCEYANSTNGICGKQPAGFSTIVKKLDLDAFRLSCK